MPASVLNAYAEQLPQITATESLMEAERIAVGSGTLRRSVSRQILSAWGRQADQQRVLIRPKNRAMYDAQMGMAGIAVKRVPKLDG